MDKLIVIDGNSLLFRAYYATAYSGQIMRSQDGTPTNAIFAFSNMINKIISTLKEGDGIFVAFDTGHKTFRHKALDSYKANRKPAPEELVLQFPLSRDFLSSFGVFQFEMDGYEGDDIAGTVATTAAKNGIKVFLYTSDRDFLQLVDDNISVNMIKKGLSDVQIMTPQLVKETYGFLPRQVIDYKGLRGDASDNLPGIPGIGEKTALKLIEKYQSFDNIIAHAEEIGGKVGNELLLNKDIGTISRDLAIIRTDIPLPFKIEDCTYEGYDFKNITDFCQKYGLKQFLNKLPKNWKKKTLSKTSITIKQVHSFEGIDISNDIGLALDYDNQNYHNATIYGLAISDNDNVYYINYEEAKNDKKLLDILSNRDINKYCYDFKAIKVSLAKDNIAIDGLKFDLLIGSYLLDSNIKNNPHLIFALYGLDLVEEEVNLFTVNKVNETSQIAYFVKKIQPKVIAELVRIDAFKLYEELELPLVIALSDMEIEGFPLDKKTLDSIGDVYKKKCKELEEEIYQYAGEKFNISSPKQLGEILYNKLHLPSNKKMSTSFENLRELSSYHPIIDKIIEYRKYFKLISTYIDGLKPHIFPDGKIHATFNQAITSTGRLSSSDPNLQNISVRDEEGKTIRKAFFYPNNEYQILSFDYSQIELRLLAHLAKSDALKKIFLENKDIHKETAKMIFHLSSEATPSQRRKAKAVNFGIIYGISDWGLAESLEISPKEAKDIINGFYSSFPEIKTFFLEVIEKATKEGYVSTMLGRRRYLGELHDSNYQTREFAKRAAMNAPIQGSAADLIKTAMIKVNKALKDGGYQTKMVLQIHDELLFKVPLEEMDKVYSLIKDIMENAIQLSVPLKVDGGYGKDWYSIK